jgi:hypothetical protein
MRLRRGSKLLRSGSIALRAFKRLNAPKARFKGSKKEVLTQKRGDFLYDEKTNS